MPDSPAEYRLRLTPRLAVSFQRTARVTETSVRPPTSYGALPIWLADREARRELAADALLPAAPSEAFWIGIEPSDDRIPSALRVGVRIAGQDALVDAVTGGLWSDDACQAPQNYVVSPPQRALYGIASSAGRARQFRGTDGVEEMAEPGIRYLRLVPAPAHHIPSLPPLPEPVPLLHSGGSGQELDQPSPNDAALGDIPQIAAPDPYGLSHWNFQAEAAVTVRLVPYREFEQRSGLARPEPLDATKIYGGWRLP